MGTWHYPGQYQLQLMEKTTQVNSMSSQDPCEGCQLAFWLSLPTPSPASPTSTLIHQPKQWSKPDCIANVFMPQCASCLIAQLCSTLCNPMDCSLLGSSVHGIFFKTRVLEWIAISPSRGSSWPRDRTGVACIAGRFFTTESWGKPWCWERLKAKGEGGSRGWDG